LPACASRWKALAEERKSHIDSDDSDYTDDSYTDDRPTQENRDRDARLSQVFTRRQLITQILRPDPDLASSDVARVLEDLDYLGARL
jgi:hypothetical protein